MNEAIKHNVLNYLADAYKNASLRNENMIEFSKLTEPFRSHFQSARTMVEIRDCLDNYLGASFDNRMPIITISAFRNKLIKEIIETLALDFEKQLHVSANEGIKKFWDAYLDFFFDWHLFFAGTFFNRCQPALQKAGFQTTDLTQFTLLIEQARWVETLPIIKILKHTNEFSKRHKANMLALEAAIELHYVGNITAAKECIKLALATDISQPYAFELEGRILSEEKNFEGARNKFTEMASRFPGNIQYKVNIGNTWEKENLPQLALQVYNEILIENPGNVNTLHNRIILLHTSNEEKEKRRIEINNFADKLLFIEPESTYDTYVRAGFAHENAGDYSDAEKWFQLAINNNPLRPEAYNSFGQVLVKQINNDEPTGEEANILAQKATSYFIKSIELAPNLFDGYWNLALLQFKQKAYNDAIETLDKCSPNCPKFERLIHMQKCYFYQELKDWENANASLLAAAALFNNGDPISNFIDDSAKFYRDQLQKEEASPEPLFAFLEKLKSILPANAMEFYYKLEIEIAVSFNRKNNAYIKTLQDAVAQFPENDFFIQQKIEWLDTLPDATDEKSETIISAYKRFPDKYVFTDWLRKDLYGYVYDSIADPKPIYIDCHESIVHLFLDPSTNELLSGFLDKIDAFRINFMDRFGLQIPALQFRLFNSSNDYYDFYTTIDEIIIVIGNKIKEDFYLVNSSADHLDNAGITYENPAYPSPILPLYWISKADEEKAKAAGILLYEPIEIILFHLQGQIWKHMERFVRFHDNEIMTLLEKEPIGICRSFMTLAQIMLEQKAPVIRKDVLLIRLKMGLERKLNIQQIAAEIMKIDEYKPIHFWEPKQKARHRIGAGIDTYIRESIASTVKNNWFLKIKPEACQEILSAFRNIENQQEAFIEVVDQASAWALSAITKMEFPFLQFELSSDRQKKSSDTVAKEIDIY